MLSKHENLSVFFGDIHNHCDMSYGHGSLTEAIHNARLQLDFASITVHAVWPDLPTDDPKLEYLVEYHKVGFTKAQANWPQYLETTERLNEDGKFVLLPSFEWHSLEYGDYCIYYRHAQNVPIIDAPDLPVMREMLHDIDCPSFLIPHHIGYRQGSRGINWRAFDSELSPVAEIFSFHGLSESTDGPYPYLHSMGPRHEHSTAQYGWEQGHIFGIVGSTDHHNAFPGSYGYGRMGVWAESLSRDAIWKAIQQRHTYALTGDRIKLAFSLNDGFIGDICNPNKHRSIDVNVNGGSSIDYIEVLHNNQVIHRENVFQQERNRGCFKIYVEMGWAEQTDPVSWDVSIDVENGRVHDVEPRFRGQSPTHVADDEFSYITFEHDDNHLRLQTKSFQNPSLHTAATEGISIEIEGSSETCLNVVMNGQAHKVMLHELLTGSRTFYIGGFVSPALCFHRAVPQVEYQHQFSLSRQIESSKRDWYYVRVRQRNNQWAWSSPIWIEGI